MQHYRHRPGGEQARPTPSVRVLTTFLIATGLALAACLALEVFAGDSIARASLAPRDLGLRLLGYLLILLFWFEFSWRPWLAGLTCVITVAILIVVSRAKTPRPGHIVVALVHGDRTLKRLKRLDGRLWLVPEAEGYPHTVVDEYVEIWGVVVGLARRYV